MFTGIVGALGRIAALEHIDQGARVTIDAADLQLHDVAVGDSIAVNGVCLTATVVTSTTFGVDVSPETLACTAGFESGGMVNLEKALRLADRLGGHLVSGHVDGIGIVERFEACGDNRLLSVRIPAELQRYVSKKGSITLNGVSLTVNSIERDIVDVNLIPHTLAATNLKSLAPGHRLNIEVDLIARYLERLQARE
jgi:riboflavin synthase